jgi:hypothetical protein
MNPTPMTRSQYFNVATGTVRAGSTSHGESLTDVESGLLPLARSTASSLHSWGVAGGLTVTAATGQPGVTVAPGAALDAVEALNEQFTYHLTVLGEIGAATITQPVQENGFRIRSDRPGAEVCWLLLGVRRDPWATAHRIQVEEDKEDHARGRDLHPDVRGGGPQAFARPEHEELLLRSQE